MIHFIIHGQLPTLNDYTNKNRTHWAVGAAMKRSATQKVVEACKNIDIPKNKVVVLHYTWDISTKHDLDNVCFAQKFVQDGLVEAGKLPNDSRRYIKGFTHTFNVVDKGKDKVSIEIELL